jgi:hypothetical protein
VKCFLDVCIFNDSLGGASEIGGVVFEVIDHVGRVRDIRKSKSSLPLGINLQTEKQIKSIGMETGSIDTGSSNYREVGEGEGSIDTVAEALSRLTSNTRKALDPFSPEGSRQQREREKERLPSSEKAIFVTNPWLRAMAENFPPNEFTRVIPYGGEEVHRAIEKVQLLCPMNPSQLSALESAISQTVSLIQGPPGKVDMFTD